jgi:16S rRNA (guanine527-N7)-methyltransferase
MRPEALTAVRGIASVLGLPMGDGQADALVAYLELLKRWNSTYNLTAVRDPADMLTQHLADCLAVVPAVEQWYALHPGGRRILDVGSGGGLPGVVLAVMLPTMDVTCVDTVGKKAAFIQQVALELGLRNLHAVHSRVESMKDAPFDLIVSRAFASLSEFTRLTEARLRDTGEWLAMKGREPGEEIAALAPGRQVFHVEHVAVPGLDAQRCLVWMRRAAPSGAVPA